jgi:hypothetical protein
MLSVLLHGADRLLCVALNSPVVRENAHPGTIPDCTFGFVEVTAAECMRITVPLRTHLQLFKLLMILGHGTLLICWFCSFFNIDPESCLIGASQMTDPGDAKGVTPTKSREDNRQYRVITLKNDLQVLLVHDPEAEKSGAALDVAVGHFQDPAELPGLAHACEHLSFMVSRLVAVTLRAWQGQQREWCRARRNTLTRTRSAASSTSTAAVRMRSPAWRMYENCLLLLAGARS